MYNGDNKANYSFQVMIGHTYQFVFCLLCLFVCLFDVVVLICIFNKQNSAGRT